MKRSQFLKLLTMTPLAFLLPSLAQAKPTWWRNLEIDVELAGLKNYTALRRGITGHTTHTSSIRIEDWQARVLLWNYHFALRDPRRAGIEGHTDRNGIKPGVWCRLVDEMPGSKFMGHRVYLRRTNKSYYLAVMSLERDFEA